MLSIIRELKTHLASVTLNSNGYLINEGMLKHLEEADLDILKVSFYSLNEEDHNFLRGNSEAYKNAMHAIDLISKSKIKLEIGILITARNIKELPNLIEFLKKYQNVSIILQPLDESIESESSKNPHTNLLLQELWPNKKDVIAFFQWIEENPQMIKNNQAGLRAIKEYYSDPTSSLKYRCFAGQRGLIIHPDGRLALCFKGRIIGNLKNESLQHILAGENAQQERIRTKHCQKCCRIIGCNFSRGIIEFVKDKIK